MAETKITSLLIPYEVDGETKFAQPNTIKVNTEEEGYPEKYIELREVKNDEGEVIWGKYDWLIEDDDGQATKLSEIAENPDKYTKWSTIFDTALSELNVYNGTANLAESVFGMPNIQTLDVKNSILNSDSAKDSNYYYSDILTASPTVREGFYIGTNVTSSSWGATQKPYLNLRDSKSPLKDYILEPTSLLNTLTIYPKYGTVKSNTLTWDCLSLDFENMNYLYTENPLYTTGYFYNYNGIASGVSIADKTFKFGSKLKVIYKYLEGTTNKDWLIPQENIPYTYNLNRTEYDKNTDTDHYLMTPNKTIKFPIEVSYPLYLKKTPTWNTTRVVTGTTVSGETITPTYATCHYLKDADLTLNSLVIESLAKNPIKVTLRSNYRGFCAGLATEGNVSNLDHYTTRKAVIDTYTGFMNQGNLLTPTTIILGKSEGTSVVEVSFNSLVSTGEDQNFYAYDPKLSDNPWDKKEGYLQVGFPASCTYQEWVYKTSTVDEDLEDPYATSTMSLDGGVTTPDPDIDIPTIGGGGITGPVAPDFPTKLCTTSDKTYYHTTKPTVCYLTYSWDNKLYYVDYLSSSPVVTPLIGVIKTTSTISSQFASYSRSTGCTTLTGIPNFQFSMGDLNSKVINLSQYATALSWTLKVEYFTAGGLRINQTSVPIKEMDMSNTTDKANCWLASPVTLNWDDSTSPYLQTIPGPALTTVSKVRYSYVISAIVDGVTLEAVWASDLIPLNKQA